MTATAYPTAYTGIQTNESQHGDSLHSYPSSDDGNLTAREFLKYLPPGTNEYQYRGMEDVSEIIRKEHDRWLLEEAGSQFVIISNFPEKMIHDDAFDATVVSKYFSSYHKNLRILLLKMVSTAHAEATLRFSNLIIIPTADMGLQYELIGQSNAEVQGEHRSKAADCAFRPVVLPPGRSNVWPTIVAEVGFSETAPQLEADVRWWLESSNGDVQIAITIDVHRGSRSAIIFERWEVAPRAQTRAHPTRFIPQRMQKVIVEKPPGQTTPTVANIRVDGAPMTLEFRKIFLRNPTGTETDIVITDNDFKNFARMVWLAP